MDILKIFRMQEPVSRELLSKTSEIGKFKEEVQEKDVLLKNNRARIKELENQVADLENKNRELEKQLNQPSQCENNECLKVLYDYNLFIEQLCQERQTMVKENELLLQHISELEATSRKINENLEKAKVVILGMKENEDILKSQLADYEIAIERLSKNYVILKDYSESKLGEANTEIINKNKENIREVAALKSKLLQSQARICELQKHVPINSICSKSNMFEPLKSNLST